MPTSLGTVRVLTFPMEEWHSFYNTVGPHKTIILQTVIKHLKKRHRNWDYLDWTGLLQQGREKERLETAGILHGLRLEQHPGRECSMINLEKDGIPSGPVRMKRCEKKLTPWSGVCRRWVRSV
ncbi:MAG: hypothetical protein R3C11_21000 [Planctomycetaceae bacterium]